MNFITLLNGDRNSARGADAGDGHRDRDVAGSDAGGNRRIDLEDAGGQKWRGSGVRDVVGGLVAEFSDNGEPEVWRRASK